MEGSLLVRFEASRGEARRDLEQALTAPSVAGTAEPNQVFRGEGPSFQFEYFLSADIWGMAEQIMRALSGLGAERIFAHLVGDDTSLVVYFDGQKMRVLEQFEGSLVEESDGEAERELEVLEDLAAQYADLARAPAASTVQRRRPGAGRDGSGGPTPGHAAPPHGGWRTEDAGWMAERAEKWEGVLASLSALSGFVAAEAMPHLKQYYLNGKAIPAAVQKGLFKGNPLFVELWFDPDASLEHLHDLVSRANARSSHEYDNTKERFFQFTRDLRFDTCYGMMGGREEALVGLFVPEQDSEEFARRQFEQSKVLNPYDFMRTFLYAGQGLLMSDLSSPYIAYQYMIPYWETCCNFVFKYAEADIRNNFERRENLRKSKSAFKLLLRVAREFDHASTHECKRDNARIFRDALLERLRRGRFPDELIVLFNRAFDQ